MVECTRRVVKTLYLSQIVIATSDRAEDTIVYTYKTYRQVNYIPALRVIAPDSHRLSPLSGVDFDSNLDIRGSAKSTKTR